MLRVEDYTHLWAERNHILGFFHVAHCLTETTDPVQIAPDGSASVSSLLNQSHRIPPHNAKNNSRRKKTMEFWSLPARKADIEPDCAESKAELAKTLKALDQPGLDALDRRILSARENSLRSDVRGSQGAA